MKPYTYHVGLTGGIASGKSAVSTLFADLGIDVIDADVISKQITERDQVGYQCIVEHFGPSILQAQGELDRAQLADVIFTHPQEKYWLEQTLHPFIRKEMQRQLRQTTSVYALIVVPLLAESAHPYQFDRICVVDSSPACQIARLKQYRGLTDQQAKHMLAAQCCRAVRLKLADDIIKNHRRLAALGLQVQHLHHLYTQYSQSKRLNVQADDQ